MSSDVKAYCYGFDTGCRKLYLSSVGCCKPEKVGNHWASLSISCYLLINYALANLVKRPLPSCVNSLHSSVLLLV